MPFQADSSEGGSMSILVGMESPAANHPQEEDVAVHVLVPSGPSDASTADHAAPDHQQQQEQQQQEAGPDDLQLLQLSVKGRIKDMPGTWDLAASCSGRLSREGTPQGTRLLLHPPSTTSSSGNSNNNHANGSSSGGGGGGEEEEEAAAGLQQVLRSGRYLLCSQLVQAAGSAQVRRACWMNVLPINSTCMFL
jgi:hypothetical protein